MWKRTMPAKILVARSCSHLTTVWRVIFLFCNKQLQHAALNALPLPMFLAIATNNPVDGRLSTILCMWAASSWRRSFDTSMSLRFFKRALSLCNYWTLLWRVPELVQSIETTDTQLELCELLGTQDQQQLLLQRSLATPIGASLALKCLGSLQNALDCVSAKRLQRNMRMQICRYISIITEPFDQSVIQHVICRHTYAAIWL